MNNKIPIFAALWALSLILTYWLASSEQDRFGPASGDDVSEVDKSRPNSQTASAKSPQRKYEPSRKIKASVPSNSAGAVEEETFERSLTMKEALAAALRGDDALTRNLQIAELLANLTADDVPAALAAFQEAPRGFRNDDYFRLFMHAWAKIDPEAAVTYAYFEKDVRKVAYGGTIAMAEWAKQDPAAAKAYLDEAEADDRTKRSMLDGLVRGWVDSDLTGASGYVQSLPESRERGHFLDILAREYVEQRGLDGAMEWAKGASGSEQDSDFGASLVSKVAREVARKDPQQAASWIEQNMNSDFIDKSAFQTVANRLADKDPLAAAAWVEKHLDDERMDGGAISEVTREWAHRDPVAAAEWVGKFMEENEIRGDALITVSREWAEKDPQAAIEWASALEQDDVRKRSMATAVERWSREDLGAAGEWLNTVELTESHDPAVHVFAQVLSREDPKTAFAWAQSIQDEEFRERSTIEVARTWYRQDAETIKEWLPDSGLTEEQQKAVTNPPRRDWGRGGSRGGGGRGPGSGGGRPQR